MKSFKFLWELSTILIAIGLLLILGAPIFLLFSFNAEVMGTSQIIFITGLLFFIIGILFYVVSSNSKIKEYKNKKSAIFQTFIGGPIIIIINIFILVSLVQNFIGYINNYTFPAESKKIIERKDLQNIFSKNMHTYCLKQKDIELEQCLCTYKRLSLFLDNDELFRYRTEEISISEEFYIKKAREECKDTEIQKWTEETYRDNRI